MVAATLSGVSSAEIVASRLLVCWPVISICSPLEPGISTSVDYFGPPPVTS